MISFHKHNEPVLIWTGRAMLDGVVTVPCHAEGLIIIVGLGGTFHHEAMRSMAGEFQLERFATLIADVLTADEQQFDARTGHFRLDTQFLASRVRDIVKWAQREAALQDLRVALFGGSAMAVACMKAAGDLSLFAMALTAPRFELVAGHLQQLDTPTLLMFDQAPGLPQLRDLAVPPFVVNVVTIPGVSSLLENQVVADTASREAAAWFRQHVPSLTAA